MTTDQIAKYRLYNQRLTDGQAAAPTELVRHLGAVQSQDYAMAKWAIGVRSGAQHASVQAAIDRGEIIRVHVLRPTWHLVANDDIRWMLALTAPHIKRALAAMCRNRALDDSSLKTCNRVIEKLLAGNQYATREEIMAQIAKKKIATDDIRSALIMFHAEMNALVCNGPMRGRQFTYALFDERVPPASSLTREEALARLALRYFTGHGPATLHDFSWWSGLSLTNSKLAIELVKTSFHSELVDDKRYWFKQMETSDVVPFEQVLFLPSYDECLVGYTDRTAMLPASAAKEIITVNGIFKPVVVAGGRVVALWKRTVKKETVFIEVQYGKGAKKLPKAVVFAAAKQYGDFMGMKTSLVQ